MNPPNSNHTTPIRRKTFLQTHLPHQSSPLSQSNAAHQFLTSPTNENFDDAAGGNSSINGDSIGETGHASHCYFRDSENMPVYNVAPNKSAAQAAAANPLLVTPERNKNASQQHHQFRKLSVSSPSNISNNNNMDGGGLMAGGAFPKEYQTALRRFRSLSVTPAKKDKPEWTRDAIRKKYTPEKTIELYDFSPEFETIDLNLMLEPYQHNKCDKGGYRIKWLCDTRALALFRRQEMASKVLGDLESSKLVKVRPYQFQPGDLDMFNQRNEDRENSKPGTSSQNASAATTPKILKAAVPLEEEAVRIKYRTEVTIELYDFVTPMGTGELQQLFNDYKSEDNIVRIKWFNKSRAVAWFSNPSLVTQALNDLSSNESIRVKPYVFTPADMKYFLPDASRSPVASPTGTLSRRRTISKHSSNLGRRNTVSGASHYRYHGNNNNRNNEDYNHPDADIPPVPKLPQIN
ncbi:hypothetical protein H4219_001383 [Mycoemilia scoparia]|uniref:Uncharacterized protein n=1 Tax=Mycoemilia scoparia TaxID=417184 RepID=A0A9W8DRZ2_9FUNG|nr:hypothetical protein H4219_001383 [Mycoemilia scoparia]